jgi:peptide/nickel transport system substrate-binding protein
VTDPGAVDANRKTGSFDLALDYVGGTCARAKDLGGHLATENIPKPKDAAVNLNTERYSNPAVDKIVDAYLDTTDPAAQQQYLDKIIDVYTTQFPVIALQYAPQRLIFNTQVATGWPTAADKYPTDQLLLVMTHLRPKEG